ncbi:hypothetical protein D5R81_17940 [Parashewanella spongiae]|uniref:Calcineurin-like phosphoesterase domain-containing protein n=1 Tax=Parashewanella spongiae TaxID=342950 RepID=A0A3A6THD6_9GAMM|nr:metallophosphoesterase [Parashewanella spongiae]MCL1077880.1 metallophosphoesterase [Parashewanella spongiae]RJY06329.1 hypothetical protein D5R81_17940 [Parashewanella spongiae]
MKLLLTNLKHFGFTFFILLTLLILFGINIGADAKLHEDKLAYKLSGETHVFFDDDKLIKKVLRGRQDDGFYVETTTYDSTTPISFPISFPQDESQFSVTLSNEFEVPSSRYHDGESIIAVSDFESSFGAFRDFLVTHGIVDKQLNWTFGKGHLVLVGDFVDRGASTTQLLWGIYQLEQSAKKLGGKVHYIIGNHEIKSLQGNYQSAHEKYFYIAGILGKQQYQLFDHNSFLGRWLASKNVVEVINDVAFVHGGLHPQIQNHSDTLDDINHIVRNGYRQLYFTPVKESKESFLRSSTTGLAWYRGYFKDDLTHQQIDQGLKSIKAKSVVVGHTIQSKVNSLYDGKVIAIDVKHPQDYLTSIPFRNIEGLLIKNGERFRLLDNGETLSL